MFISEQELEDFKTKLEKVKNDYEKFKHTSLTKDFLKDYNLTYHHAQAILEMDLLDIRKKYGNGRMKEYKWAGGEPTLVMARKVIETTNDLKNGIRQVLPEFTDKDKLNLIKSGMKIGNLPTVVSDDKLMRIINLIEYVVDNEWESKMHEIIEIVKSDKDE